MTILNMMPRDYLSNHFKELFDKLIELNVRENTVFFTLYDRSTDEELKDNIDFLFQRIDENAIKTNRNTFDVTNELLQILNRISSNVDKESFLIIIENLKKLNSIKSF